jgi:hypothetical protein
MQTSIGCLLPTYVLLFDTAFPKVLTASPFSNENPEIDPNDYLK